MSKKQCCRCNKQSFKNYHERHYCPYHLEEVILQDFRENNPPEAQALQDLIEKIRPSPFFQTRIGGRVMINEHKVIKLNLSNLSLSSLPETIGNFQHLQGLEIVSNLSSLPESFGNLKNLTVLSISSDFEEFPMVITNLKSLNILSLSNGRFSEITPEISNLTNLQTLNLVNNRITKLPANIGHLKSLKKLNLRGNKLSLLPVSIGNLENLISLDISGNKSISLTEELMHLKSLREIYFDSTVYVPNPLLISFLSININGKPFEIYRDYGTQLLQALKDIRINDHTKFLEICNTVLDRVRQFDQFDPFDISSVCCIFFEFSEFSEMYEELISPLIRTSKPEDFGLLILFSQINLEVWDSILDEIEKTTEERYWAIIEELAARSIDNFEDKYGISIEISFFIDFFKTEDQKQFRSALTILKNICYPSDCDVYLLIDVFNILMHSLLEFTPDIDEDIVIILNRMTGEDYDLKVWYKGSKFYRLAVSDSEYIGIRSDNRNRSKKARSDPVCKICNNHTYSEEDYRINPRLTLCDYCGCILDCGYLELMCEDGRRLKYICFHCFRQKVTNIAELGGGRLREILETRNYREVWGSVGTISKILDKINYGEVRGRVGKINKISRANDKNWDLKLTQKCIICERQCERVGGRRVEFDDRTGDRIILKSIEDHCCICRGRDDVLCYRCKDFSSSNILVYPLDKKSCDTTLRYKEDLIASISDLDTLKQWLEENIPFSVNIDDSVNDLIIVSAEKGFDLEQYISKIKKNFSNYSAVKKNDEQNDISFKIAEVYPITEREATQIIDRYDSTENLLNEVRNILYRQGAFHSYPEVDEAESKENTLKNKLKLRIMQGHKISKKELSEWLESAQEIYNLLADRVN